MCTRCVCTAKKVIYLRGKTLMIREAHMAVVKLKILPQLMLALDIATDLLQNLVDNKYISRRAVDN